MTASAKGLPHSVHMLEPLVHWCAAGSGDKADRGA